MPHTTITEEQVGPYTRRVDCSCGWFRYCHTDEQAVAHKNAHLYASHRLELTQHVAGQDRTADRGACATCKGEGMVEIEHEHADGSASYAYTTCPRNCNN